MLQQHGQLVQGVASLAPMDVRHPQPGFATTHPRAQIPALAELSLFLQHACNLWQLTSLGATHLGHACSPARLVFSGVVCRRTVQWPASQERSFVGAKETRCSFQWVHSPQYMSSYVTTGHRGG